MGTIQSHRQPAARPGPDAAGCTVVVVDMLLGRLQLRGSELSREAKKCKERSVINVGLPMSEYLK